MTRPERERLFDGILEEHGPRLRRVSAGYAGSAEAADDLMQEIMINVWKGLPSFRRDAALATWLYRIAVNTALMHRRRQRRHDVLSGYPLDGLPPIAAAAPPAGDPRIAQLHKAIGALRPVDRLCVTLLLEGFSYKYIASVTGLTVNHVGVRLSRAKRELEGRMREDRGEL